MVTTEIERIARVLHLRKNNEESGANLCLIIQGKIKELISNNNKLKFTNTMLKQQNQILRSKLDNINKNLKIQKANKNQEDYKINMDKMMSDTYKNIKKRVNEVNKENDIVRTENKYLANKVRQLEKKLLL
mgnify:CR=1 FL=1